MHIASHVMSGWCLGNLVPWSGRERMLCMFAATLADLDGVGMIFGERVYQEYHHVLCHNLGFAVLSALVLAGFAKWRWVGFGMFLGLAHLHLVMDYFGSGPGWAICYWWPFDRSVSAPWMNPHAWEFYSWPNLLTALLLFLWTVGIGYFCGRTPLEAMMPELDRKILRRFGRVV